MNFPAPVLLARKFTQAPGYRFGLHPEKQLLLHSGSHSGVGILGSSYTMRLPFPTHLNMQYVLIGVALALFAQLLNGTDPMFAVLDCAALIFTALAFNVVGGLSTTSGALILFLALSTYALTIFVKILTFEPAQRNFHQPMMTIGATTLAFFGIMVSAWLSRKFITRRPLVRFSARDLENLSNTAGGLVVLGFLSQLLLSYAIPEGQKIENGSIWAILNQMNSFIPLAIVLGTYYTIYMSNGTRSVNWISVSAMLYSSGIGFAAASKQGMYAPIFSYFLVCAGLRYSFRRLQVFFILFWIAFALGFLFPWAQYARSFTRQPTLGKTVVAAYEALINPNTIPAMYRWYHDSQILNEDVNQVQLCYDHPHGLIDRESLICADDALIDLTLHTKPVGPDYLITGFEMVVPHFMWPDRPSVFLGNVYGRDTGLVGDEDTSTQAAFAPVGDAYREFGWSGVSIVLPVLFFLTFLVVDNVFGDTRNTPWGLLMVSYVAVIAPGMLLPMHPLLWGHMIPMILGLVWITRYVAPQVAVAFGLRKIETKIVAIEETAVR